MSAHLVPKDDTLDKIKLKILQREAVELSPKQEFKLERLILADRFTYLHKSRKDAIAFLMEYMKHHPAADGYSERTAERDYYDAQVVFGYARKFDKTYKRNFYINWIEEKMVHMDDREFNRAMTNLIKLGGFEKEDVDPPQKDLRLHDIILTYDPTLLGLERIPDLEEKKKQLLAKKKKAKAAPFIEDAEEDAHE